MNLGGSRGHASAGAQGCWPGEAERGLAAPLRSQPGLGERLDLVGWVIAPPLWAQLTFSCALERGVDKGGGLLPQFISFPLGVCYNLTHDNQSSPSRPVTPLKHSPVSHLPLHLVIITSAPISTPLPLSLAHSVSPNLS